MAKKSRQRKKQKKQAPDSNSPWLSMNTEMIGMSVLSLVLATFMVWQLYPSEGLWRTLLWGVGFGVAIWAALFPKLCLQHLDSAPAPARQLGWHPRRGNRKAMRQTLW